MIPAGLLPPVQRPPHDPETLVFTARRLWSETLSEGLSFDLGKGCLRLSGSATLQDPNGTLGGLTLPRNVAVAGDGSIYVLDRRTAVLKRFDACECRFVPVPCFGSEGGDARQLRNPSGIEICGDRLFVCDTGEEESDSAASECAVADRTWKAKDNHRVTVVSLRGFVLLGHWSPPRSAYEGIPPALALRWRPVDVACDSQGLMHVADEANGCVHRFTPRGTWLGSLGGLGAMTHLAIDCQDRVYVMSEGAQTIKVIEKDGTGVADIPVATSSPNEKEQPARLDHHHDAKRPEDLAPYFPSVPFTVDQNGYLHLGDMCQQDPREKGVCKEPKSEAERGLFDLSGEPVRGNSAIQVPPFQTTGTVISAAMDSERYHCVWHRIVMWGTIPSGTSIEVATVTSEVEHSSDEIQALPQEAWSQPVKATRMDDGQWDMLVQSPPGRFLWLHMTWKGNGYQSPEVASMDVECPRISLRRYLPAVFGQEAVSANFTDRFLGIFDTTIRSIETTLDHLARYFDPMSTPSDRRAGRTDFLSWLASWVGMSFDRQWPEDKRRRFLKQAGKLFSQRGTVEGLRKQLLLYLGMEAERLGCADDQPQRTCTPSPRNCVPTGKQPCVWKPPLLILEQYRLRGWLLLGEGRLHDRAVLWGRQIVNRTQLSPQRAQVGQTQLILRQDPPRDPFHVYAHQFSVFVPAKWKRSDSGRKGLENLVKQESPAHTRYIIHYVAPRFQIGVQSMLGFDTAIGHWPQGVTLDDARLGQGTILTVPPHLAGGAGLVVGKDARIGATTQLR